MRLDGEYNGTDPYRLASSFDGVSSRYVSSQHVSTRLITSQHFVSSRFLSTRLVTTHHVPERRIATVSNLSFSIKIS